VGDKANLRGFFMPPSNTLDMTAEMVAAFVSNNSVPSSGLAALIQTIHDALTNLSSGAASGVAKEEAKEPAVPIRRSIAPDYLICLDDGKKFKSLKRHLAALGMTPAQYRAKWKLPSDYPMVAPEYAAKRSELAKAIGLGQVRRQAGPRKRGRPPKPANA
jgi:predicted transcriptional regulator